MPKSQFQFTVMAAAMSALFAPALHAAGAGRVDFATPGVNAVGPNGQARPLTKGAEIQPGETIDTGAGRAQLRFTDGGMVSLAPQTQFRLETYGYDKDDPKKNSIVMNMLKGGLRTITGLIGKTNREGYKLQTATATVGIRGTEFSITGFPDGSILFHVSDGAIDVTNQSGSSTINGGQSAIVNSQTSTPTKTDEKPFLPPVVSAAATQLPAPTNAVQDSQPIVQPILTGTFQGQWRTASFQVGGGQGQLDNPDNYGGAAPTFTLSPSGHLTSYGYGGGSQQQVAANTAGRTVTLGSAGAQSYGNDGVMAWGRWIGTVSDSTASEGTMTYTAADPLHYVVGLPVSAMPTSGSATYTMYGGTAPSCSGACGAISVGSTLSVNFGGTYSGSYDMKIANTSGSVNLSGGGSLSFYDNNVSFNGNGGMTGSGINGTASNQIKGFFAGPGASHAGAVYRVDYQTSGYGGTYTSITGAAVYKK